MPHKKLFEVICKSINKCEARLGKYTIAPQEATEQQDEIKQIDETDLEDREVTGRCNRHSTAFAKDICRGPDHPKQLEESERGDRQAEKGGLEQLPNEETLHAAEEVVKKYAAFTDLQKEQQPKICTWTYMGEPDVKFLLQLNNKQKIREAVDRKINQEYPKGISRLLYVELMYSVVRFCQKFKFNLKQTGTLLSIFHLTHQYFLMSLYTTTKRTYNFFKEYMLLHCFECPPDSVQLFSYEESIQIMQYFCRLYLHNLPLIRLLTLPNFGFCLNYEKQPDLFEEIKGMKNKNKNGKRKDKKGKASK